MLNKVILMGRLTRDPELRATATDISVTAFTLAVDRGYSRRDNGPQQTADFINIVAWRNTAEFVCRWLKKGQLVAVSGRLQVRNYEDREGNKRIATEVVADEVFFAEKKSVGRDPSTAPAGFAQDDTGRVETYTGAELTAERDGFAEMYQEYIGDDGELPF